MVGLALEGGGAKGSYQVGAYMALKKCGIRVDAVTGTSIGSFNGAMIAAHQEDKLLSLWKDATMHELLGIDDEKAQEILKSGFSLGKLKASFTEIYKILKNKGLDMSNYRAVVRNSIDEEALRKSNIKFGLTAVKLENYEPIEIFIDDIPNGQVPDYIVASSYLPIFKKEKLIDDGYYLDGGFYNLCPTDMLESIGCDKIYVINIKGIGIRKPNIKSKARIIEIKPSTNLGSMVLFDKTTNEENITRGYYDTMRTLDKIDGVEFYFYKKPVWYYKRLNHNISGKLYKAASAILNSFNEKETVIKALEYILKNEKMSDLKKYKQSDVIKLASEKKNENIIYRYVRSLNFW